MESVEQLAIVTEPLTIFRYRRMNCEHLPDPKDPINFCYKLLLFFFFSAAAAASCFVRISREEPFSTLLQDIAFALLFIIIIIINNK